MMTSVLYIFIKKKRFVVSSCFQQQITFVHVQGLIILKGISSTLTCSDFVLILCLFCLPVV